MPFFFVREGARKRRIEGCGWTGRREEEDAGGREVGEVLEEEAVEEETAGHGLSRGNVK